MTVALTDSKTSLAALGMVIHDPYEAVRDSKGPPYLQLGIDGVSDEEFTLAERRTVYEMGLEIYLPEITTQDESLTIMMNAIRLIRAMPAYRASSLSAVPGETGQKLQAEIDWLMEYPV